MNFGQPPTQPGSFQITSKFIGIYGKLLQGIPPSQITPGHDQDRFFSDLLDLKVDKPYLEGEFHKLSRDACLGRLKVRVKPLSFNSEMFE